MRKKIISLAIAVMLVILAVTGATLAYFTDTDSAKNTFTVGKVDIKLNDVFVQNSKLLPAVVDEDSNILNSVDKVVSVTNEADSETAYVRVHIAVPSTIRSLIGLWTYDGAENWAGVTDTRTENPDYKVTIDGVEYCVFVYTYEKELLAGKTTTNILDAVTMEPEATNKDVEKVNGSFDIKVFAEGVQAAGFSDAYTALEEAFGTPSATNNPWTK